MQKNASPARSDRTDRTVSKFRARRTMIENEFGKKMMCNNYANKVNWTQTIRAPPVKRSSMLIGKLLNAVQKVYNSSSGHMNTTHKSTWHHNHHRQPQPRPHHSRPAPEAKGEMNVSSSLSFVSLLSNPQIVMHQMQPGRGIAKTQPLLKMATDWKQKPNVAQSRLQFSSPVAEENRQQRPTKEQLMTMANGRRFSFDLQPNLFTAVALSYDPVKVTSSSPLSNWPLPPLSSHYIISNRSAISSSTSFSPSSSSKSMPKAGNFNLAHKSHLVTTQQSINQKLDPLHHPVDSSRFRLPDLESNLSIESQLNPQELQRKASQFYWLCYFNNVSCF